MTLKTARTAGLALLLLASPAFSEPAAADFRLKDPSGREHALADASDAPAVVLFFVSTQCPLSNRYLPEMARVASDFRERRVAVFGINPNANEQAEVASHARERAIPFTVLLDSDHALADRLGVGMTPTAVVLDSKRQIRYLGRLDGEPMTAAATGADLRAALEAVLEGKDVAVARTEVRGCAVRRGEVAKDGAVTWARDIAPILQQNCVQCHRAGQIGPMPLDDFEHASAFAPEIKRAVQSGAMPPWKPVGGPKFEGERKLSREAIDKIVAWADSGTPQGDPKEEPPMPEFPTGWLNGEPDVVFDIGGDFEVPTGPDLYWHFVIAPGFGEDKWIKTVEVKPGNSRIVHHVLAYLDQTGIADRLDAEDEGLGYEGSGAFPGFIPTGEMGGWTPGFFARPLPSGVARKLPKKSKIILQIHYNNPSGSAQMDRTQIGLYFSKEPVRQQLYQARILNPFLKIPAGEARHTQNASWSVRRDITVISVMPHMHLIGREISMIAETDSGKSITLVDIKDWDFKWQDTYVLKKPIRLNDGSRVTVTATYDNTADNPRNPNKPPKTVRWGENTNDEMLLGYVNYVKDHQDLTKPKKTRK